ncbi:MAG: response regulator [Methylocystis sp.]
MTNGATIHIVDDDRAILDSLGLLLTAEGFVVRTHVCSLAFLDTIQPTDRGCVVTDVLMPKVNGLDLLATLNERGLFLPVIFITAFADVPLAITAMKRGARDFFEKPLDTDALLASIRSVLTPGNDQHPADAESQMIRERFISLSKRENELLSALLKGKQNKDIARELGISVRTVEIHRAHVMEKMQAVSLAELVKMALAVESA